MFKFLQEPKNVLRGLAYAYPPSNLTKNIICNEGGPAYAYRPLLPSLRI
jgi:hypothetical protein